MRPYYMVSGILLILPIIDFAVSAPVLAQEKPRASVDIPEDATTILKRFDDWRELWAELKYLNGHAKAGKAGESSAAGPSSSSQLPSSPPSGPADGLKVTQPPPSIPEELQVPVSNPDHAPPSPAASGNEPKDSEAKPRPLGLASLSQDELKRLIDISMQ